MVTVTIRGRGTQNENDSRGDRQGIDTWILHLIRRYELCAFIFHFSTIDRSEHPAVFIQDFYLSFCRSTMSL
ncbi:MAG: hypothetical protein K9L59_18795, partial [Desulfobacterales bacterium]|nr:hypothetical protein [Desulfobacterales bacterium]